MSIIIFYRSIRASRSHLCALWCVFLLSVLISVPVAVYAEKEEVESPIVSEEANAVVESGESMSLEEIDGRIEAKSDELIRLRRQRISQRSQLERDDDELRELVAERDRLRIELQKKEEAIEHIVKGNASYAQVLTDEQSVNDELRSLIAKKAVRQAAEDQNSEP